MPRKKVIKDDKDTSNKKVGRPSGNNELEDTHPRLQLNFFRTQVMVYDTTIVPARNEIEFMLGNCQRYIDDGFYYYTTRTCWNRGHSLKFS